MSGSFPIHGPDGRGAAAASASTLRPAPRARRLLLALMGLLFFVLAAVISEPSNFHGDERFYTDAVLRMLQTGDFWTPYYPDGQLRLNKPILTYWAIAGSVKLFGTGPFAVRLAFLLAGVLVVGLTFHLARIVGHDERTALVAALIAASNVELLTLASRATPDVLLILCVLVSMIGFARIRFQGDTSWLGPVLAFGGMGLAVQTKGLLGLCPLVVLVLCRLAERPVQPVWRNRWLWPALALGIGLGVFWYAAMLQQQGLSALKDFYADQVGAKVTHQPVSMFGNALAYAFAGFRHFLPWTLLLLAGAIWHRRELVGYVKSHRADSVFLLGLMAALIVGFSFGNMRRPRYIAASYPLFAVWLAGAIAQRLEQAEGRRWLTRLILGLSGVSFVAGVGLFAMGAGCEWRLMAGGGVLTALGWAGWLAARAPCGIIRWMWVASLGMVAFAISGACLRPVLSPSSLGSVAASLSETTPSPVRIHAWCMSESAASELRLLGRGKWKIHLLEDTQASLESSGVETVLTTEPHQIDLARAGYKLHPIGSRSSAMDGTWFGQRLAPRTAKLFVHASPPYWLGVKVR